MAETECAATGHGLRQEPQHGWPFLDLDLEAKRL